MSKAATPGHRRRRWMIAFSALSLVAGLQLAAVPPQLFADPGLCFMECSVEGRSCCCRQLAGLEPVDPHAPEAAADGDLSSPRAACRELCAAFANKAPGADALLLALVRCDLAPPVAASHAGRGSVSFRSLNHSDPSTLPRPPPSVARS